VEPATLTAQRTAIQNVRARYERGELTLEEFRRALDALVQARDADECQAIVRALPAPQLAPLAVLDPEHSLTASATALPRARRIIAFMGQTKKLRLPWRLGPYVRTLAFMGEAQLDLGLAELPPQARIHVTAIMGAVTLYVPRSARVTVRTSAVLSDTNSLGESASGVVAFAHEEHVPTDVPGSPHLEIEVFTLMGNVKVVLRDRPVVSIGELVRDALQAAAAGIQRGLLQGTQRRPALEGGRGHDGE
jgi:hypothetical protein